MTGRACRALCLLILTTVAVTACVAGVGPPAGQRSSGLITYGPETVTNFWLPTAVLPLDSAEGTFIRAATESYTALLTGSDGRFAYPGFRTNSDMTFVNAMPERRPEDVFSPKLDSAFTVMSVDRSNSESGRALLCVASKVQYGGSAPINVDRRELRYTKAGRSPVASAPGPAPRPGVDVFGGWRLTDTQFLPRNSSAESRACTNSGLEKFVGRASSPGWPALDSNTASVTPTP